MQQVMAHNAKKEIIEKIVEREVIKEVKVGISEEEMREIRKQSEDEKQRLMKQAQDDMKQLIAAQSRTAQERAELQAALDREAEDRRRLEEQKAKYQAKLKVGGLHAKFHFANRFLIFFFNISILLAAV